MRDRWKAPSMREGWVGWYFTPSPLLHTASVNSPAKREDRETTSSVDDGVPQKAGERMASPARSRWRRWTKEPIKSSHRWLPKPGGEGRCSLRESAIRSHDARSGASSGRASEEARRREWAKSREWPMGGAGLAPCPACRYASRKIEQKERSRHMHRASLILHGRFGRRWRRDGFRRFVTVSERRGLMPIIILIIVFV